MDLKPVVMILFSALGAPCSLAQASRASSACSAYCSMSVGWTCGCEGRGCLTAAYSFDSLGCVTCVT